MEQLLQVEVEVLDRIDGVSDRIVVDTRRLHFWLARTLWPNLQ